MNTILHIARIVNIVIALAGITMWVFAYRKNKWIVSAIAPISWLAFALSFFVIRELQLIKDVYVLNLYGLLVIMTGEALLLSAAIALSVISLRRNGHQ